MTFFAHLSVNELGPLLQMVQQSFAVRRHVELFNWLQDDIQSFLPHDILIAAWGDFSLNLICYDIVSPLDGLRTEDFNDKTIQPFILSLFNRWLVCDRSPYTLNSEQGFSSDEITNPLIIDAMQRMRCALVHGIKDQRGRHDCLYVMLGSSELHSRRSHEALRFLMPYIDTAFRQVAHLPEQYLSEILEEPLPTAEPEQAPGPQAVNENFHGLSTREMDIIQWVRKGKTNQEIGLILDISSFTVKNHLQRIFKKLDVLNRAQAVAKLENAPRNARK